MDYSSITLAYLFGMAGVTFYACRSQASSCSEITLAKIARLLGAATGLKNSLQMQVWEPLRSSYENLSSLVHEQMGTSAWETSFAEGRELPLDEALTLTNNLDSERMTQIRSHS